MTTKTTTSLRLDVRGWWLLHERQIGRASWGGVFATVLLLIHALLKPAAAPAAPMVPVATQARTILVATATAGPPVPTATPWPTPEPQVVYLTAPTEPPQVIYVQSAPVTSQEAPGATEGDTPDTVDVAPAISPPAAPPEAPANAGPGGSGKMIAPHVEIPAAVEGDAAARWCAAAASAGKVHCAP